VQKVIKTQFASLETHCLFSYKKKYSITEYTDFTTEFFTFKMTFSLTVHAQMKCNLCPYEQYDLPYAIFMKLTHTEQYYMHSSCSEIYPNLTTVDSMDKYLIMSIRKVQLSLSWISWTHRPWQIFVENHLHEIVFRYEEIWTLHGQNLMHTLWRIFLPLCQFLQKPKAHQWHCMEILYNKFHPKWMKNIDNTGKIIISNPN
jgi:hypothetical protein